MYVGTHGINSQFYFLKFYGIFSGIIILTYIAIIFGSNKFLNVPNFIQYSAYILVRKRREKKEEEKAVEEKKVEEANDKTEEG